MMKVKILSDNRTERSGCLAEWGLSIYIETEEMTLLLDAGASPEVFVHNAKKMGVDLNSAEALVISHGHYDHTQGVPEFCRINQSAPIYLHRDALIPTYDLKSNGRAEPIGILWGEETKRELAPRLKFSDGETRLTENIAISGPVTPAEGFQPAETFYRKGADGAFRADEMAHERVLAIRRSNGIYIFSGCSHNGVEGCIRAAKELFPGEAIALLMAGMHLIAADQDARERTAAMLKRQEIQRVMPIHCTGIEAICELKKELGLRCLLPCAGSTLRFQ